MDAQNINHIIANSGNYKSANIMEIPSRFEHINYNRYIMTRSLSLKNSTTMLIISLFL